MPLEQKSVERVQYRNKVEVSQAILEMLVDGQRSWSDIFYTQRLSYTQIKSYGAWLAENGLVKNADSAFTITSKGRAYLKALQHADAILKGVVA